MSMVRNPWLSFALDGVAIEPGVHGRDRKSCRQFHARDLAKAVFFVEAVSREELRGRSQIDLAHRMVAAPVHERAQQQACDGMRSAAVFGGNEHLAQR